MFTNARSYTWMLSLILLLLSWEACMLGMLAITHPECCFIHKLMKYISMIIHWFIVIVIDLSVFWLAMVPIQQVLVTTVLSSSLPLLSPWCLNMLFQYPIIKAQYLEKNVHYWDNISSADIPRLTLAAKLGK